MAIITFSAPLSGIRGKVGGLVYSRNLAGPYLKAWGRGSNPRTTRQTNHRSNLVQFSKSWADLTSGERDGWNTYAALPAQDKTNSLGESFSVSGFAWFIEINLNLNSSGEAQRDAAPTGSTPGTPILTNFLARETGSAGTTRFQLDAASPSVTDNHTVKSRVFNSKGHTVQAEIKTFMISETSTGTRQFIFQDELEEHFGTIQIDQNVFATIQVQNSEGRRGSVLAASALAIA